MPRGLGLGVKQIEHGAMVRVFRRTHVTRRLVEHQIAGPELLEQSAGKFDSTLRVDTRARIGDHHVGDADLPATDSPLGL